MDGTISLDHYFIEHCRIWFYHNTTHVTWSHVNA